MKVLVPNFHAIVILWSVLIGTNIEVTLGSQVSVHPLEVLQTFFQQALPFSNSRRAHSDNAADSEHTAQKELVAMSEARNKLFELLSSSIALPERSYMNKSESHGVGLYNGDLSSKCGNQTAHMLNGIYNEEMWAMQMLDAWGKPPSGFLTGQLNWVGDYKECKDIRSEYGKEDDPGLVAYQGQYCTGMHPSSIPNEGQNMSVVYQLGICIPSGCDNVDAVAIYNFFLQFIAPATLKENSVVCQPLPGKKEWRPLSVFTYVITGIIALICVSAGLYDYAIHDTLIYYKIHRLPIPLKLMANTHVQNKEYSVEEDGNLTDNDHLERETDEEEFTSKPTIYTPASSRESAGLTVRRIWLSFSCYTNGYKILTPSQPQGSINCIHGVRFISLTWVILGHSILFAMQCIAAPGVLVEWIDDFPFQAIMNATVSVDSFFMISGLLTSYLTLKEYSRRQIGLKDFFLSLPVMYLHRYLRLTPALGFMILFYMYGVYNLTTGPLWPTLPVIDVNCVNNSWVPLLYLNNIYKPGQQCAVWTWYLANDFQFFIVSPFLIALLYRYSRVGLLLNVICIVTSSISAMVITYKYNLRLALIAKGDSGDPTQFTSNPWFVDYYVAPWCRYSAYGVGVIYGYIVWKTNGKLNYHWVLNVLLWLVSAALCLLPLYGPYDLEIGNHNITVAESVTYNALSRISWCIGLGYLVLACHSGRGGWVNEFLSWKGFIPVSRMTYCAYLIHPVVMIVVTMSHQSLIRINYAIYAYMFVTFLVLSYAMAFVFSLLFEAPFLNLDKLLITGALKKKQE